ncbi:hypothetical protein [Streptomyces sp. NBC_00690]|uniref:hypothetical protein n=1 Tax=Streptomyces sp. NBC_00690 TaxID=2975808 RepID=UPI002E2C25B4|nr:hypothetical protein [Streptomyces sp. NBC_00690]
MKAAVATRAGASPRYLDSPEPEAGAGEHLVDLVAAAIHPVVRSKATGRHYSSTGAYPLVPGVDAAAARLGDSTPDLVLDFLWGTAAEAAFGALSKMPGTDAVDYVEIGAVIGEGRPCPPHSYAAAPSA